MTRRVSRTDECPKCLTDNMFHTVQMCCAAVTSRTSSREIPGLDGRKKHEIRRTLMGGVRTERVIRPVQTFSGVDEGEYEKSFFVPLSESSRREPALQDA